MIFLRTRKISFLSGLLLMIFAEITLCPSVNLEQPVVVLILFFLILGLRSRDTAAMLVGNKIQLLFAEFACIIIKFSSQGRDRLLFLPTNMADVTSDANQESAKLWNALPDFISTTELTGFRIQGHILYCRFSFSLMHVFLNIMYLVTYPYILCILASNVMSRRYYLL